MQFDGEANGLDLCTDIDFWAGSDDTSYPVPAKARNANFALDRVTALIMRSDGRWKWDDDNQSGTPIIASTALVAGTADYTFAVTHLKILRVRVKDSGGNWITLTPVERRDISNSLLTASSGTPRHYDLLGDTITLLPAPNYSISNALEFQIQRGASYFTASATTTVPGFASQFHRLISLYAAFDYCDANELDARARKLEEHIAKMEAELVEFYSSRRADAQPRIRPRREDYGQSTLGGGAIGGNHPDKW